MKAEQVVMVGLPAILCQEAEAKLLGGHFTSLEDLITFVLQELLNDEAQRMDEREQELIEQRLRDLGYI